MGSETTNPAACNCLALRQAARHVTQFYDQFLAPSGLRATQYSILARLARRGAMTINALAAELVMDRTTLGRNIRPLQRDRLIAVAAGTADRRSKELRLTESRRGAVSRRAQSLASGAGAVRNRLRRPARQRAARAVAASRDKPTARRRQSRSGLARQVVTKC